MQNHWVEKNHIFIGCGSTGRDGIFGCSELHWLTPTMSDTYSGARIVFIHDWIGLDWIVEREAFKAFKQTRK